MLTEFTVKRSKNSCTLLLNGNEVKSNNNIYTLLTRAFDISMYRQFKGDIIISYSKANSIIEQTKEAYIITETSEIEKRRKAGILRYDLDWFIYLKERFGIDFDIYSFINRWILDDTKPLYIDYTYEGITKILKVGDFIIIDGNDTKNIYHINVEEENE